MHPSARALALLAALTTFSVAVEAQQAGKTDPRAELASKIPGAKPEELRPSPVPGLYEMMRGTDVAYVTEDGKYVLDGDLYDLKSNDNLTESRRRDVRLKMLAGVPESEMVVFSPRDPKHTITVFTDVDCSYCRKLHSQIGEYNRLGMRVRYLFYPRTGPDSESWEKAVEVWCSPKRNEALTRAKRGEDLKVKACGNSPVERHYELGQAFSIRGTPAIILDNGELLPGYVPPEMLAKALEEEGR
jgi:thiol:disulfide interchange protein DsbC